MNEFSVILKNNVVSSSPEFNILDNYAQPGIQLYVIERYKNGVSFTIRHRTLEYIFDEETLIMFCIVSDNILAKWNADITKTLTLGKEHMVADTLFVTPYYPRTIDLINF